MRLLDIGITLLSPVVTQRLAPGRTLAMQQYADQYKPKA